MSIISKIAAGVVGAAILLAGSAASATQYWVAFSGTIASGTDSGLFGAPGDLTGKSFVATYTYNTVGSSRDTVPGVRDTIFPAPVTLKIGDVTYAFPTFGLLGSFANATVGGLNFNFLSSIDADPVDVESILNTASSPWFQPNLDFGGNAIISASGGGGFGITVCCCPSCGPSFKEIRSSGTFVTDTVKIAVPESGSWASMIAGFGLAGAVLRRRRGALAA